MARLVKNMVCIEVDPRLSAAFREVMAGSIESNITFIESDAMKIDYNKLSREFKINKVISNLPYKIAAPLIITILKYAPGVEKMYLTIQKDIADRLLAKTGDKNYSSYTGESVFLADFKKMFYIPRTCFMPVPKVDFVYSVCRKDMKDSKICSVLVDDFFSFIDNCFLHRRKKLVNSLQKILEKYNVDKKRFNGLKCYMSIGKDAEVRAEELTADDFMSLFLALNIPKF